MVKIRLARFGNKRRPYYHVVVTDSENPRDGRFLEQVGTYDPARPITDAKLDLSRIEHWLSVGAQPSDTVRDMLAERDLLTPKLVKQREMDRKMANQRREKKEAAAKAAEEAKAAAQADAAKAAEEAAAKKAAEEAAKAEAPAE